MTMLPNQRHPLGILMRKRTGKNRTSIRATKTELRGPSTEVRHLVRMHQAVLRRRVTEVQSTGLCSHFDCSFRLLDLRRFKARLAFVWRLRFVPSLWSLKL